MPEALRHREMREHNQVLILGLIQRCAPVTRPELGRRSGLTKASITRIVQELVSQDLVSEVPAQGAGNGGRPATGLRMRAGALASVGVELRIDRCAVVLRDLSGVELGRWEERMVPGADPEQVLAEVGRQVRELRRDRPHEVVGVGVSVGGSATDDGQGIADSLYLGWSDVDVAGLLAPYLPGVPLRVLDVSCCAAQASFEYLGYQAGQRGDRLPTRSELVHVQCGIGLGAGRPGGWDVSLPPQASSLPVGHVPIDPSGPRCRTCGWNGCLDSVLGFTALMRRTEELGVSPGQDPRYMEDYCRQVAAVAAGGDRRAAGALESLADDLARAVVMIALLARPGHLTIGGWPAYLGEDFVEEVRRRVRAHRDCRSLIISVGDLGDDASLVGASMIGASVGLLARLTDQAG
ncbi:ROK family transcriptional regulator [Actinomyces urogenitalis]|uniref:ROK family transcriptional regulator n=1 Tax=Actinomyces urogenitalis TaxID=103621 RepID=UPI00242EC799|nr:ROK family transcriptional regulator [Actinomyces urogenitalis]MCI7457234.1 ROK family transcriptional regulator [Actinomyces urogenitalis]